jgi:hypothetical protein
MKLYGVNALGLFFTLANSCKAVKYETSDDFCAALQEPKESGFYYSKNAWKCSCTSEDGDGYSYSCSEKCEYHVESTFKFRESHVGLCTYEEGANEATLPRIEDYREILGVPSCYEYEDGSLFCFDDISTLWVNGKASFI